MLLAFEWCLAFSTFSPLMCSTALWRLSSSQQDQTGHRRAHHVYRLSSYNSGTSPRPRSTSAPSTQSLCLCGFAPRHPQLSRELSLEHNTRMQQDMEVDGCVWTGRRTLQAQRSDVYTVGSFVDMPEFRLLNTRVCYSPWSSLRQWLSYTARSTLFASGSIATAWALNICFWQRVLPATSMRRLRCVSATRLQEIHFSRSSHASPLA